jgi:hypothetical protein
MELSKLVACNLTTDDLKSQAERWTRLVETVGLGRTETDNGLRLSFRYDPVIEEELRALVAVENECCGWAAWEVARAGEVLVMVARSQWEGIATLHTMFANI